MNASRTILLGVALLALSACESTPTSDSGRPELPHEAAGYNAQLALAYMAKNDLAAAKEKIERALKQDPRNVDVQMAAGLVYDRLGKDKEADEHYAAAMRLKPGDPDIANNYGAYLCSKGRTKEGEKLLLRAAGNATYRTPWVAYTNAGVCMLRAGEQDEAEKYFQTALQLKPRFGDALLQLADLSFERGQLTEASGLVKRYLAALPASAEILWLGVRIERARGDSSTADAYAKRLKSEYPKTEQTRALLASERQSG